MNDDEVEKWAEGWVDRIDQLKQKLIDPNSSTEDKQKIYEEMPGLHPNWPENLADSDLDFLLQLPELLGEGQAEKVRQEISKRKAAKG